MKTDMLKQEVKDKKDLDNAKLTLADKLKRTFALKAMISMLNVSQCHDVMMCIYISYLSLPSTICRINTTRSKFALKEKRMNKNLR